MSGCQSCDGYCFQPEVCGKEIEDRPEPARMRGERAATSGAEPSAAVEGDPLLIEMARALHSHLPEDQRPVARMDFSDDQWARLEAAADVIRAPMVSVLEQLLDLPIVRGAARPLCEPWASAELFVKTPKGGR